MSRVGRFASLVGAIFLTLNAAQCERTYGRQACRMEEEVRLADTQGPPTAVAAVSAGAGRIAFAWSADGSVFSAVSSGKDLGIDKAHSIPRPGGLSLPTSAGKKTFWPRQTRASIDAEDIDLTLLPDGNLLLTLVERPAQGEGAAFAALLSSDALPLRTIRLGPAGEYASKISAAVGSDALLVTWHDGALSGSRIHLVRLDNDLSRVIARSSFGGDAAVSGPTVVSTKGAPLLAWAETGSRGDEPYSRIRTARVSADLGLDGVRTVAEGRFFYPDPSLVSDSHNDGLGLIYRDDEDKDRTPEYHFVPLTNTGAPAGEKRRISQADGLKGPRVETAEGLYVSAAVRSFQRNLLIGVNRFDRTGVKQNGEFQVYADKSDFIRVDIARGDNALVIVYAEDKRTSGRVLAGRIRCGERP